MCLLKGFSVGKYWLCWNLDFAFKLAGKYMIHMYLQMHASQVLCFRVGKVYIFQMTEKEELTDTNFSGGQRTRTDPSHL